MMFAARQAVIGALRRAAVPLGCYYATTLLVPLANGAGQSGRAFVEHAVVVASVPLVLIALVAALVGSVRVLAGTVARVWRLGKAGRAGSSLCPECADRLRS